MKNKTSNRNIIHVNFDMKNARTEKIQYKTDNGDDEEREVFTFEGHAATFGNIDFADDIIEKGAFEKSIKNRMPKLLAQHDFFGFPIGGIKSIHEDDKGLFIKAELPMDDTRVSGMIAPQMKSGNLDAMSIGFRVVESEQNSKTGIRILKEIDLREISLVTFPANEQATVTGFKSEYGIDDVEDVVTKKAFEDLLQSTGNFSRKACTYLASRFQENQSDSGNLENQSDSGNQKTKQSDSVTKSELDGLFDSMQNLTEKMRS